MSLEKAIKYGKEYRKQYYNSGKFDITCRPHGGCPWCYGNRKNKENYKIKQMEKEIKEYIEDNHENT